MRTWCLIVVGVVLGWAMLAVPACQDSGQTQQAIVAAREQGDKLVGDLTEQKAQAARDVEAAQSDPAKAEAEKRLAAVESTLAAVSKANQVLKESTKPDGSIDAAAMPVAICTAVGGPYGTIIGLGIAAVVGFVQEMRVRRRTDDAVSLINGLSAANASVPGFAAAMSTAKPLFQAEQTAGAKRLVTKHKLAKLPKAVVA